jgi:hypothetical protein
VARYTLTPRGDVDGLLLSDGTEVHFPPHISAQLVYAIKPGDAITRYPWSTRWDAKFIESSFTEGKGTSDTSELLGPPPNRQTA